MSYLPPEAPGHDLWAQAVGAYLLGALPDDEAARFERHLEACARCREDVAALRLASDALPVSVPQRMAPPELKDRIMAVVEREAAAEHAPARARRPRRPPLLRLRPALVLAGVLGLLGAGIAADRTLLDTGTTTIAATVATDRASAALVRRGDEGRLVVRGLPAPPAGRVYQVWLQRGKAAPEPTNALFSVARDGSASVAVPGSLDGVDAVLVTDEPAGGSRAPTRTPVISARL